VVEAQPRDAGIAETRGTLEVYSTPAGALVTIGEHALGPAPRSERIAGGVRVHVKLELKGFQSYEDEVAIEPGKTVQLRQRLVPAPALLQVETAPAGAMVTLGGQPVGTTPLKLSIASARGVELSLARQGYDSTRLKVDLVAGEITHVERDLREQQKFGVVLVLVGGTADWGYVWWKGKNLGQNYTMASGQTPFRLPVGRQQIRIEHPRATARTVTVDVIEHEPARVTVTL
jgi:hypothetical protein